MRKSGCLTNMENTVYHQDDHQDEFFLMLLDIMENFPDTVLSNEKKKLNNATADLKTELSSN